MVVGIKSFGAYIPLYRLGSEILAQVWGSKITDAEKAIANWDEDSLTMAAEAVTDCMGGIAREKIDGLYYATTTPVYIEKQNASIIAKALDLNRNLVTADFSHSLRGASSALTAALNAVQSGAAANFMVACSDCRIPAPDSTFEAIFGDGAAAILLGNTDVIAEIEGSYSISSEFLDIWKRKEDTYVQTWEDRFTIEHGYFEHIEEIISNIYQKYNLGPKDFKKVVISAYDSRRHTELVKKLGFDIKTQVQDPLLKTVGNTGTASAMMMLVAALEEAKPNDRILVVNYGDGADALILRVTEQITRLGPRRGIKKHLASKAKLTTYGKYLHFRNLMQWEARREIPSMASLPMSWRDRDWILSFKGNKCKQCNNVHFPPQRICPWCLTKDNFDSVVMSDKKAKLFTYGIDYLAVSPDPPIVGVIIDFDGGGRLTTTMTDRQLDKVILGMSLEMTFRFIHDSRGYRNYFWKCRPIRV